MNGGLLLVLGALVLLVLVPLPFVLRGVSPAGRDRRWAMRNGWTEATTTHAASPQILRHLAGPEPDPDGGPVAIRSETTIESAWLKRLHGHDTLIVIGHTVLGKARGRETYVLVLLPRRTPMLSVFPIHPGMSAGLRANATLTGDAGFDARFAVVTGDPRFARKVLTDPVRRLLHRADTLMRREHGVPGSFQFDGGVLSCLEHARRPVAEAALLADLLAGIAAELR